MRDLQKKGISFALDDFGSESTSFRHLKDFWFDIFKIDGEFTRGFEGNSDNQMLTQILLSIAHHFHMFSMAQSVESSAASRWLRIVALDCQKGNYFARPTVNPPCQTRSKAEQGKSGKMAS